MINGLDKLEAEKNTYDKESQDFIDSLRFVDREIDELNSMKATEGWKLLDAKIRSELQIRINLLIKDDVQVKTLLALLSVADTKSMSKTLDEEVSKLIPS